ncbi:MAG: hypothetical protein JO356_14910, partial [Acidobacteria bacterium]|nr:hypothetical protein [Acidobacteriota bacterium]
MLLTAVLEMTGLSILYPVVLAMGHDHAMLQRIFARLPVSAPWLQNTSTQIAILFATVGVVNITKNVVLYHTYHYDMSFAMYYYRNLIRGLYSAYVHKPVLEFRQESSGSLASIICVQSQRLIDGVIRPLLILCTEGILLIGIALLVWYVSPILIVVLITACGGTAIGYYTLLRAKAHRWGQQRMHAAAVLQELVNNTSFGIGEIKI